MASTIRKEMSVEQLCDGYLMSLLDLENLLGASTKYLKFTSSSKAPTWIMCVNSYFNYQFPNQSEKVKIKVSTYHDVKEVKWNRAEKQAEVSQKLLVMGTKMKEENWKDQKYTLRYWMIFEIQPEGVYQTDKKSHERWNVEFESAKPQGFEYQHIHERSKDYGNFIVRKRGSCMFQVNYHIRNESGWKDIPMTDQGQVPTVSDDYLGLQSKMEALQHAIQRLGVLEYPKFIDTMKDIFTENGCEFELKRLDSFVF